MKEYILQLIDADIKKVNKLLNLWNRMPPKFKLDPYQIDRRLGMENRLDEIKEYKALVETEL
jgi:hypothetical protein